jgi:hypothetical protein
MPAGRLREAMDLVPEEVIDSMTITGNLQDCAARIREYEGIADEVILARTAQRGEAKGLAAYEDFFELVDRVSGRIGILTGMFGQSSEYRNRSGAPY